MDEKEVQTLARYIFNKGRMIQEHVFRIQARCCAEAGKKAGFEDLSMSQFSAVKAARLEGEVTISRLAEILGVSVPSASVMVDRLVEKKILTRERSREDRRKVVVRVSPVVARDMERVEDAIFRSFVEIVRKVGPDVAKKWHEALTKVKTVIENQ